MILDCDHKILHFKGTGIPFIENKRLKVHYAQSTTLENIDQTNIKKGGTHCLSNNDRHTLLTETTHFNPGEQKLVQLTCPEGVQTGDTIWLEPLSHNMNIEYDDSIHTIPPHNKIHIMIKNASSNLMTIYKDTKIGNIIKHFQIHEHTRDTNTNRIYEINTLTLQNIRELREKELSVQDFQLQHLHEDIRHRFEKLLVSKAHAFSKSYITLGQTSAVVPKFNLSHNFPIQTKPYRIPQSVQDFAKGELQRLMEAGIIERAESQYAFPVIFVKKKQEGNENKQKSDKIRYRMAIDFRILNDILEPVPHPLPDVYEILREISGKNYYTVLDLHSAFYQINVKEEDKHKLSFITQYGQFLINRLPFGTRISSSTFAKLMDKVFENFDKKHVHYYLDDIVLSTNSIEQMLKLIEQVLNQLIKFNLTIEPSKLQICKTEIEFLGHKVDKNGYAPSDKNIKKISEFPRPKSRKEMQKFLGCIGFFKNSIHDYAEIACPLTDLTKDKNKFEWSEEAENAFIQLQDAILNNPTLKPPNYNEPFFLITDASKHATSSILTQEENGYLVPIEFYGRKLKEAETRYHSVKLELLAIYESVKHFQHMLAGRHFTILTDSEVLTEHVDLSKRSDVMARWITELNDFDFDIQHIPGIVNPADYLSRHINTLQHADHLQLDLFRVDKKLDETNIRAEQLKDTKLNKIIESLKADKKNQSLSKYELNKNGTLILKLQNHLQNDNVYICPQSLKESVMASAHAPHYAFKKTYQTIKQRFSWNCMYQDVKKFTAECIKCNRFKYHNTVKVPIQTMPKTQVIGKKLYMDIVGPFTRTLKQNAFILTVMDEASRFLEAFAIRNMEATTIVGCLNKYFSSFGLARELRMDNAKYFRSTLLKDYANNLNITPIYSSIYHPTSQSPLERVHKDLKNSLACLCNSTYEWDIKLDFFKLHHNTQINRSLGYSPSMLFFAREINTPFLNFNEVPNINESKFVTKRIKFMKEIFKNVKINQQRVENENKQSSMARPNTFKIGDTVYLKALIPQGSLRNKYSGPYKVQRVFRNENYLIANDTDKTLKPVKIHVSKLFAPAALND